MRKTFAYLFRALVREAREGRRYGDEACKGLANTILSLYLRLLSGGEEKYLSPNETYLRAKAYIDEHYLSLGKMEELCAELYVSRYYLTHLFREYSGVSPLQYALGKRTEHAKTPPQGDRSRGGGDRGGGGIRGDGVLYPQFPTARGKNARRVPPRRAGRVSGASVFRAAGGAYDGRYVVNGNYDTEHSKQRSAGCSPRGFPLTA